MKKLLTLPVIAAAFLALAAWLVWAPAFSQERIRFDDLNLGTDEGVAALYLRITLSARSVCGDPEQVVQVYARERIAQCVKATVAETVRRVHNEHLLAYAKTK